MSLATQWITQSNDFIFELELEYTRMPYKPVPMQTNPGDYQPAKWNTLAAAVAGTAVVYKN